MLKNYLMNGERVNHETVRVALKDARYLEDQRRNRKQKGPRALYQNQEEKNEDN